MQDKHPEEQEGMLQEEENSMEWRPQDAEREMVKPQIRDRVRSAKVADNAVFIPARPEPKSTMADRRWWPLTRGSVR